MDPYPSALAIAPQLPNNTQFKVTAIDIGVNRRHSQIETEMGKIRFNRGKESETPLNNISEFERNNNTSAYHDQSHLGSLLRQSQSGFNLPPEKM